MAKKSKKDQPLNESDLEKLMKLSKRMKDENVQVPAKGLPRGGNPWRTANPKFNERTDKPTNTVDAGGMQMDPERREEYENWRKDKEAEAQYRREIQARRLKAAEEELRKAQRAADGPDATPE